MHNRWHRWIVAMATAMAVVAGCASPSVAQDQATVSRGKALIEAQCARCHAVEPTGESPLKAAPPMRVVAKKQPVEHLAEALAEGIMTGHADMPVFTFEPDQIDDILAYLRTLRALP